MDTQAATHDAFLRRMTAAEEALDEKEEALADAHVASTLALGTTRIERELAQNSTCNF